MPSGDPPPFQEDFVARSQRINAFEGQSCVDKGECLDSLRPSIFEETAAMPNTKSAEKRVRSNARKAARNRSVKSRLKTLEKKYLATVGSAKVEETKAALSEVASALDKAAKGGVIHSATASRKRSRLQLRMNAAAKAAAAPKA